MLNEHTAGAHDDVYNALGECINSGEIDSFYVYPFLQKVNNGLSSQKINNEIVQVAEDFQPDLILWSHTIKLKISSETIEKLKSLSSKPQMGYWDGDIYESPFKPLPANVSNLAKNCDVVFCQEFGKMTNLLKDKGCKDIRYVPAATDSDRFNRENTSVNKEYDVVLIGNNVINKLPWKRMPGAVYRKKLIEYFYKKLGDRFAVFGSGWKGEYAKGPVNFVDQTKVYQKSRLALGVNNLHSDFYFSNRLPIALTSGVPLLYNYENGLEKLFPQNIITFFNSVEDAWTKTKNLLEKNDNELNKIGSEAKQFALENFSMKNNFSYMIQVLKNNFSLQPAKIENPWIQN